jgi:CRISPR/Cas system-associated endonuclease Cas1
MTEDADVFTAEELKENHQRVVMTYIERKLAEYEELSRRSEDRDDKEETAKQLADVLPSPAVLDKILRYEGALERQLYRAMNQLERLQRRREGEDVPPPVTMQLSRG